MVFFLALRNITRNKKNNAIVALLFALITFLLFIGNSLLGKVDRSIRQAYSESLTGDVVVEKAGDITMNLFGANTPVIDSFFTIPVLPAHDAVLNMVAAEPGIAGITSQVSGRAYMDMLNVREPVLLCGVDAASYFSLFPGIVLEEGRFLRAGEYGAMLTLDRAQRIEEQSGQRLAIGTPVLLTSGGDMGFKIREVPLVGIYSYKNPGQFMNEIVIVDPQTVRVLNSIQVAGGAAKDNAAGGEAALLLPATDDIFGEAFSAGSSADADSSADAESLPGNANSAGEAGFSVELLRNYLRESGSETTGEETGGDWNFIMLRLDKGISAASFIASLNKKLGSYGVTAVNWRIASGNSAILPLLVQILFNAGIFLVSVAGVIAAINIILISVFRRTREIGTLRAIGASDTYIRLLFFSENLGIALIAGFAGVLGGLVFVRWINALDLRIPNELIASILGGSVLRLEFIPNIAVFSLIIAVVLGLIASVYPVEAAVRIDPIVAVRRG